MEGALLHMRVVRYERASGFKVTSSEAAMMLSRSEFVTVYELIADPEEIDEKKLELNFNSMMTMHGNGGNDYRRIHRYP